MKNSFLTLAFLYLLNCHPVYSQIVINEIMYAPSDASNEWFELFNTGDTVVNLHNWKWKDATSTLRTITSQNLYIGANGYIIICQDSVKFKIQFPGLSGIHIETSWSTLNNTGDNLILINAENIREDSVSFQTSWGGNSGGYSLEKINPSGLSNDPADWGTSADPYRATPDRQNSITPKLYDLILKTFNITPLFPSSGENLNFEFIIKNTGLNTAENFHLNIYRDINFDSIPDDNELLNSKSYSSLNHGDSILYNYSVQNIDTGLKQYIAKIFYPQDNDTTNNKLLRRIFVSSQAGVGGGLVINEIMYDPFSNQSEWIELLNASGQIINLKSWKYKEASSSVNLSVNDLFLRPGDYFILAHDSTIYNSFGYLKMQEANRTIKFSTGINLNNSGEGISVTDSVNNVIDAVNYSPGWNNPELTYTKGISLERINPAFNSNDENNWSSSANILGGTPGLQNSIFTKNINSNSAVSVIPNPFSPDGDGLEDFTLIKYKLKVVFAQMRVRVYDIKGRLVRTLSNNQLTSGEGTIIFNGLDDDNRKLRIGIYFLIIEAIDDRGGTINIVKAPVVIAAKL